MRSACSEVIGWEKYWSKDAVMYWKEREAVSAMERHSPEYLALGRFYVS